MSYSKDFMAVFVILAQCHHGGFIDHNPFSLHTDKRIGCAKVDGQIVGKPAIDGIKKHSREPPYLAAKDDIVG
jgi:hypothetical protein